MTLRCRKSRIKSTKTKKFPAFERIRPFSISLSSSSDTECAVANFFGVSTSSRPLSSSSWGPIQLNKFGFSFGLRFLTVRKCSQARDYRYVTESKWNLSSQHFINLIVPLIFGDGVDSSLWLFCIIRSSLIFIIALCSLGSLRRGPLVIVICRNKMGT